ncbi:MAG: hypothetical protein ACOY81_12130 [Bacillota bacterium]|uniref:hypothetical protein n=1 Tax=Desulfurispora thermophila TaxID=265470 RepID=UPI000373CF9A|nr:hypothetical protein [Desulfurispora thermophila]
MSWAFVLSLLAVLALVYFSLRERVRLRVLRNKKGWDEQSSKVTPFSEALTNLIGMAGGIYLSLMVFFSFLELDLPSRVRILSLYVEPVAAVSFALALVQPFVLRLIKRS